MLDRQYACMQAFSTHTHTRTHLDRDFVRVPEAVEEPLPQLEHVAGFHGVLVSEEAGEGLKPLVPRMIVSGAQCPAMSAWQHTVSGPLLNQSTGQSATHPNLPCKLAVPHVQTRGSL